MQKLTTTTNGISVIVLLKVSSVNSYTTDLSMSTFAYATPTKNMESIILLSGFIAFEKKSVTKSQQFSRSFEKVSEGRELSKHLFIFLQSYLIVHLLMRAYYVVMVKFISILRLVVRTKFSL